MGFESCVKDAVGAQLGVERGWCVKMKEMLYVAHGKGGEKLGDV